MISKNELKVLEIIKENIPDKTIKILELCPGEGFLTKALYEAGYTNIEVMDIDLGNLEFKEIKHHQGNISEPLPFADNAYDLVLCCEGIEHLENQYFFASECNRVIKDDGYLLLTTPNITNFASRLRFLFTGFFSLATRPSSEFKKNWFIEHIYPITFWQLRHILHTNGLFIKKLCTYRLRSSALWPGIPFWPISYIITRRAMTEEGDPRQRELNYEIHRQMHTAALFFGRSQIVLAKKQHSDYIR